MVTLKKKKILVTGGCGFIGSHLVIRLVKEGAYLTVLDDLTSGRIENIAEVRGDVKFIKGDIRDSLTLRQALKGIELISHQAALRSVPKSVKRPFEYHQVNVTGTLKLFLRAKELGIKRIAFASSSSVYGEEAAFPEKESHLPKPISPYAATKLMGEHYAFLFSKLFNLEIVSLRYFNVYGPRQSLDDEYAVVVPKFITCLLKNEPCPIYGDGEQERDFTYIDNVVEANVCALGAPRVAGEVFNIASGMPHSVNHLFKSLQEIIGSETDARYLAPRPGDVRKTHADVSKAKALLGWEPLLGFEQGLEKTVDWFRCNEGARSIAKPSEASPSGDPRRVRKLGGLRSVPERGKGRK